MLFDLADFGLEVLAGISNDDDLEGVTLVAAHTYKSQLTPIIRRRGSLGSTRARAEPTLPGRLMLVRVPIAALRPNPAHGSGVTRLPDVASPKGHNCVNSP